MSKIFTKEHNTFDAIKNLVGGRLAGRADCKNMSYEDGQIQPTQSAIDAELIRMQSEYDAKDYARKRKAEYPDIYDYMDGIVKNDQTQIDKYIADAQAVKSKYPKGG